MSNVDEPMRIMIGDEDGEDELVVVKKMRDIPNRRFSGQGHWRDREVFFKIFVAEDRVDRHLARERAGSRLLKESGIATAEPLHEGPASGPGLPAKARAILFNWIEDAENLDELLRSDPSETRALALLRDLAQLIGRHHLAGVVQKDLHFANFALAGDEIYTFDAASIESRRAPIPRSAALENLALFFAQMDPGWDRAIPMILDAYAEEAGAELRPEFDKLWKRIVKERRRRMERFLEKVTRNCRLVELVERDSRKLLYSRDTLDDELRELVDRLEQGEEPLEGQAVTWQGRELRLRVFEQEGVLRPRGGRATRHSWSNAHRLRLESVPTPAPLACARGSGRPDWYLADQPLHGSLEGLTGSEVDLLESSADQIAHILQRLDQLGLEHGAMSRSSFVQLEDGRIGVTELQLLEDKGAPHPEELHETTDDMRALLEAWNGHPMGGMVLAALQRRGYALD